MRTNIREKDRFPVQSSESGNPFLVWMGKQNANQCSPKHSEGKEQKQMEIPPLSPLSTFHRFIRHDTMSEF